MVLHDLEKLKIKKIKDQKDIRKGIKELKCNKNIVIRPADRGAIVVLSKEYYNDELMGQLNEHLYQIDGEPHQELQKRTTGTYSKRSQKEDSQ